MSNRIKRDKVEESGVIKSILSFINKLRVKMNIMEDCEIKLRYRDIMLVNHKWRGYNDRLF